MKETWNGVSLQNKKGGYCIEIHYNKQAPKYYYYKFSVYQK